jgi:hypothetical protein
VDWYGTPHTEALHVVERYRLIDYEAAKEGWERDAKENWRGQPAPNYRGRYCSVHNLLKLAQRRSLSETLPMAA